EGLKGAGDARSRCKRSFDRKLKGSHPAALYCFYKQKTAYEIAFLHLFRETLERLRPPLFKIDGGRINADRGIMSIDCYGARICVATSARLETNRDSGLLVGKNRLNPNPVANPFDEFAFILRPPSHNTPPQPN